MAEYFDSWVERIGIPGGTGLAIRFGWWLFQRRRGKARGTPVIDWIVGLTLSRTALYVQQLENKVLAAENRQLKAMMREAGIPFDSGDSSGGSFDLPEAILMRSKPTSRDSSGGTSPSPDSEPA